MCDSGSPARKLEPFEAVCQADAHVKPRRTSARRPVHLSRGLLCALSVAGATALSGSGCATGVNTLEPDGEPNTAGGSSAGKGGSSGGGGSKATAGGGSVGKGGTAPQAFGGAAATGGAGGNGGAGAGGSNASGGTAGAGGGAAAGSSSGGAAGGAAGGGGTGGGAAGSGGSGVATGCLVGWEDNDACDTCTTQTQGDKLGCVDILDCYALNDCGPSTCANNDDKCGVNKIAKGTAGYEIAADVHACICE